MPILSCHCGAVKLRVETDPVEQAECNCSICRKLGWLMAYYAESAVERLTPPEAEETYIRTDIPPHLKVHRCKTCGVPTHWESLPGMSKGRMGVNVRLIDGLDLAALPLRKIDGASW